MNIPNLIYLQISGDETGEITWCDEPINDDDIEYIRAVIFDNALKAVEERFLADGRDITAINYVRSAIKLMA